MIYLSVRLGGSDRVDRQGAGIGGCQYAVDG